MIPMESDPPLHRQYKQIIAPPLSRREQDAREPYYRDLVRRVLDTFLDDGHAELFEQLCTPVTVNAYSLLTDSVFPTGSPSPKYFSAMSSDNTIEWGSFRAVSASPAINGNENICRKEGSTALVNVS